MLRLAGVVREREQECRRYWQQLEDEFYAKLQVESPVKPPPAPKVKKEISAEMQIKDEKRRYAVSRIKNWRAMTTKQRRRAVNAEYAKIAGEAKIEFLAELKLVGQKLKEAGISNP